MTSRVAPEISVVVCSFNGARTIGACLDALERQTARLQAQIVVVDDGSTDTTAEMVGAYPVDLVVHDRNRGLSAARNTGIAHALAPIVAFTDDDCVPDEGWLQALLLAHSRPEVVGAGGPVDVAHIATLVHHYLVDHPPLAPLELELAIRRSLPGRIVLYLRLMWAPQHHTNGRAIYSFPGANMSFKRDALAAVGMFDPAMTFGSDDEYICGRVRDSFPKLVLWFDPDAVVHHDYLGTIVDMFRRNYAYGRGHARVYLRDPNQRWPIVFPLPVVALMAVAVLRGWRRFIVVPLVVHGVFPQGISAAVRHQRFAYLLFSWFRLAEESAHNAGMFVGLILSVRDRWSWR
jgi:glycosyltransferase involved in cell wall biosynthesis